MALVVLAEPVVPVALAAVEVRAAQVGPVGTVMVLLRMFLQTRQAVRAIA